MTTLTMLDDKKSEMYDKLIEYLQKKGVDTPIPVSTNEELEKETGIKSNSDLSTILDAMIARNIIKKEIGATSPTFVISAEQLKDLSKVKDDCQNYVSYNNKLIDYKKVSEEYKKQVKKWQEKLIELKIMKITKFVIPNVEIPKEPECDYLSDDDKTTLKTEVISSLDKTSYNNNETLYNILRPENTEFKWNEFADVVINLKTSLEDRKEDIEDLEKAAKAGTLTSVHFIKHNRAVNLERELKHLIGEIGVYKDVAAKYGIDIMYNANKISIKSDSIPELKYESNLLSPDLIKAIKKSEDKTYDDFNVNDPLEQTEFINTIKRRKMMLPSSDEEVSTINDIITILEASGKTLTEENTTKMVLSVMDDEELKYYRLTVPTEDLARFTALVSKSTIVLETDNMVPKPKAFDESLMDVKAYEEYLLAFYTVYGLDKSYIPTENPLIVKREMYPHEKTGIGNTYYTTKYLEYLKSETKITRVDNNNYIIGRLNALKAKAPDEVKEDLDKLIAILNISDLEAKKTDGKTTDCLGFIVETEKIEDAKKLYTKLYKEIKLFAQIPMAAIVLPKDREPSQSVEEYEKYLMEHYSKENPHMVPIKNPLTEKVRKPYIHECLRKDADGTLELADTPEEKSYYKKAYLPYMASKGMHYTEREKMKGKTFSGRKVKSREDGMENKGVINALKKFGSKIGFGVKAFDESFSEENVGKIKEFLKRKVKVAIIIAVVVAILIFLIQSGLVPALLQFPVTSFKVLAGTSGLTGPALASMKSYMLCAGVGMTGVIYGIHWFRKHRKRTKYDRSHTEGPEEETETPETPTVPPIPEGATENDLERILDDLIKQYHQAKKEYEAAQALTVDATHTTEDIEKEKKEKLGIKEEKKGELVDTILDALSETEENEFDEEIGGMTL